jgi:hypothetical protein
MPALLTPSIMDLMESGEVSLYVAGCSAQLRPCAARGLGCRVSRGTSSVTTWVSRPAAPALIDDITSNGRVAVVVSHIETCKTFQLKAVDAEITGLDAADHARIADYHDAFIKYAMSIGYPEPMLRSMMQYRFDKLAAVVFSPNSVFAQTPGPGAGAPVTAGPVQ